MNPSNIILNVFFQRILLFLQPSLKRVSTLSVFYTYCVNLKATRGGHITTSLCKYDRSVGTSRRMLRFSFEGLYYIDTISRNPLLRKFSPASSGVERFLNALSTSAFPKFNKLEASELFPWGKHAVLFTAK